MSEIVRELVGIAFGCLLAMGVNMLISEYLIRQEFPEKKVKDYFWWRSEE